MNHQIYNLTANRHETSNVYLSKDTIDGWIAVLFPHEPTTSGFTRTSAPLSYKNTRFFGRLSR